MPTLTVDEGSLVGLDVTSTSTELAFPAVVTFTGEVVGVTIHNDLTGRSAGAAHPISAISGLQEALDNAGSGDVVSVNDITPSENGNVELDASGVPYDNAGRDWDPVTSPAPEDVQGAVDALLAGVSTVIESGASAAGTLSLLFTDNVDLDNLPSWLDAVLADGEGATLGFSAQDDDTQNGIYRVTDSATLAVDEPAVSNYWGVQSYATAAGSPTAAGVSVVFDLITREFVVITESGGGAELSDADPSTLGVADPGVSALASRADHRHQMPSAVDVGATTETYVDDAISGLGLGTAATKDTGTELGDVALYDTVLEFFESTSDTVEGKADKTTTITAGTGLTGGGDLSTNRTLAPDFGSGAGKVTQGNDSRLSDARTPTAHASSHASAGGDPLTLAQSQVTNLTTDLAAKAPLASPALTGTPTAPTASAATSTTQVATTAFVTTADNLKADLASPALTGNPTAPTQSAGNNSTRLATTAYVDTADNLKANLASPTFTGTVAAPTPTAADSSTKVATTAFVAGELTGKAPATRTVGTGLATTGTVNLDLSTLHGTIQTITLTGNPTFTTSNLTAGREVTLIIAAGASGRTIAYPAWIAVGAALPTSLASGKTLVVTVTATSTTDATCVAAAAAQP